MLDQLSNYPVSVIIIITMTILFIIEIDNKNVTLFKRAYKEALVAFIIALFARLDMIAPVFVIVFLFYYTTHNEISM